MLEILCHPESTMGPPWLGREKNFQNVGSQKPGNRYFMNRFCKCSKPKDVKVLRSPQTLQKLLDFDNLVTHFYPISQFFKVGGCYTPHPLVTTSLVLCFYTKSLEKVFSRQHATFHVVNSLQYLSSICQKFYTFKLQNSFVLL